MEKTFLIDEITWNDLNMEEVFNRMNHTSSTVGQEYLKKTLMSPVFDERLLKERDMKADSLLTQEETVSSLRKVFKGLGKPKKVAFLDHIFKIREIPTRSNAIHFILILLLLAAIALIFVQPAIGIIGLVVMIIVNIALYFRFKSGVEGYFQSLKYLVSMVVTASKIVKLSLPDVFSEDQKTLSEMVRIFRPLKNGSWLITNSVSGSLIDVIMDYIRMIFHVDLIKFNSMKKCAEEHADEILILYNTLGEMETSICIMEFRKERKDYCKPEFKNMEQGSDSHLNVINAYHPLVRRTPVKNSIQTSRSVLLTGSNASGKSTFLKTIAINQILAQTICTCLADRFETNWFRILSSMALKDNILGEESYFVVEIKSLKRIFDSLDHEIPVLAFVDEVLRGTNTAERIAASSQLLKSLAHKNALVFAATHDMELTTLLEQDMENYHFEEHVEGNNVLFDYKLREGRAYSRNAIALLRSYGFDPEVTEAAEEMAKEFVKQSQERAEILN
ncbi:MAG: hypothetical protein IKF90_09060 [Parasporobacterium sp.]|nr:hypothetical protein [Parasporobacterium sp.]